MLEKEIKSLGNAIKEARKKCNLTQDRLSELTGISSRHIANIEKGTANASFQVVTILVKELHISLDSIIYADEITDNEKVIKDLSLNLSKYSSNEKRLLIDLLNFLTSKFDLFLFSNEDKN